MVEDSYRSILRLNGYLQANEAFLYENAHTFVRKLPETPQLPEVTVGLGVLISTFPSSSTPQVQGVPDSFRANGYAFLNSVVERHVQFSGLPNWQERLLLDLGYAIRLPRTKKWFFTVSEAVNVFGQIPEEEKASLFDKYGFHKIATMVAYGHTENLDTMLTIFDNCKGSSYENCFRLMNIGVPVGDLPLAAQLPIEMVEELYGN